MRYLITIVLLLACLLTNAQTVSYAGSDFFAIVHTSQASSGFHSLLHAEPEKKFINYYNSSEYFQNTDNQNLIYDPVKDPKRLVYNTGVYMGAAVVSFATLWYLPESVTKWNKEQIKEEGIFNKWKENVEKGPVWDNDSFLFNWILHPWAGSVYYMSARGSGYNKWQSLGYSALMSTVFWEYGIEALAEIPAWQDLIFTPVLGAIVGEQSYKWKGQIIRNNKEVLHSRALGEVSLWVMDPFNEALDAFGYKTKNKIQSYSSFAPVGIDFDTKKPIWGMQVVVGF